jgi:hypothetical protein
MSLVEILYVELQTTYAFLTSDDLLLLFFLLVSPDLTGGVVGGTCPSIVCPLRRPVLFISLSNISVAPYYVIFIETNIIVLITANIKKTAAETLSPSVICENIFFLVRASESFFRKYASINFNCPLYAYWLAKNDMSVQVIDIVKSIQDPIRKQ